MDKSFLAVGIVGGFNRAHIGGYLARGAAQIGLAVAEFDSANAWSGSRLVRALRWRLGNRRPPRQADFSQTVAQVCKSQRIKALIATGGAPLTADDIAALRQAGVFCINYSTDDPWNRLSRADWFLRALPQYDIVATPRTANMDDLGGLGCRDVRYLPFGYDDQAHAPPAGPVDAQSHDLLFVGGADPDRVNFVRGLRQAGLSPALVGSYWDRYPGVRSSWLGSQAPDAIRGLTAAAKVNLCLVRRENRDGHVMRSFEIAATGGCILAEDTTEHRHLFGAEGEAVVYFNTPQDAAARARKLLANPVERACLARAAQSRITEGGHSYRDRLQTMLDWARQGC